ncbi:hypothetical protein E2C01_078117 [Portunus trituberculatus]|uniref:Uncharacterized protein n=1 Tax=Portunus trituberculatus TaxID=210409 RepID=A0A5B7IRV8_PORTR|nr:hypothetical protein [Portunus trituberculatus]
MAMLLLPPPRPCFYRDHTCRCLTFTCATPIAAAALTSPLRHTFLI